MDFVTHTLMGVGLARLAAPRRDQVAQYSLAGMLGSLLPDFDSWLIFLGPNSYGFYHRVITHSLVALICIGAIAGAITWGLASVTGYRRFGWFVAPNLSADTASPPRAPVVALMAVALAAAGVHWLADYITGFGNLKPFWPWSQREYSLGAVHSFDAFICGTTLVWHLALRRLSLPKSREAVLTAAYAAVIIAYVVLRVLYFERTAW